MEKRVFGLVLVLIALISISASAQDKFFAKSDIKQVWVERDTSINKYWLIVEFEVAADYQGFPIDGCSRTFDDPGNAHEFALWIAKGKIKGFRFGSGGTRNGLELADITRWYYK